MRQNVYGKGKGDPIQSKSVIDEISDSAYNEMSSDYLQLGGERRRCVDREVRPEERGTEANSFNACLVLGSRLAFI
jgi:hypothetical protein